MTTRDPAQGLARTLSQVERRLASVERGSQMRFRSLQDGSIPIYVDGEYRGQIGQLPDGTTGYEVVNGPKPVRPSAPILFPMVGGLEGEWDGRTFDFSPLPGDFRCLEVHVSPFTVFTPDASTLHLSLLRPGRFTLALPAGVWTVVFRIRTAAEMLSDPSLYATETAEAVPSNAEIEAARQEASDAADAAAAANAKALEAAGIAAGKGKVYYGTSAPAADPNGLWIDTTLVNGVPGNVPKRHNGTTWVTVSDKGIADAAAAAAAANTAAGTALTAAQNAQSKADSAWTKAETAQTTADGKNKVFWRPRSSPPPAPLIEGDIWFVTDEGNAPQKRTAAGTWVTAKFEDGAIASLNVGKLVSGEIAAGQRIIAGPLNGTHAEVTDDGFRVFLEDPVDGIPNEVARMGTGQDDIFTLASASGAQLFGVDSTGAMQAKVGHFADEVYVGGKSLSSFRSELGGRQVGRWSGNITGLDGQSGLGIRDEYGIAQFTFPVVAGRSYMVTISGPTWRFHKCGESYVNVGGSPNGGECALRFREQANAPVNVTSSRQLRRWLYSGIAEGAWQTPNNQLVFHADYTGTCNFGVSLQLNWAPNAESAVRVPEATGVEPILMEAFDMGPSGSPSGGNQSNMGGGLYGGPAAPPPPPAKQSYFVDLMPVGWVSYRGDGSRRTDVTGPVQGPDPSGANGIQSGHWYYDIPNINAGAITRMEFGAFATHWYENSGGFAVVNATIAGNGGPNYGNSTKGNLNIGRWPRGAWWNFDLPADWWPHFTNSPPGGLKFDGIRVGPAVFQNEYGRFNGDGRLRIWWTQ